MIKCPLPSNSIDVLVMLNVLEHIEDDDQALRNAFRILTPGGHIIIEVPAVPFLFTNYDRALKHFRRYSSRALTSLMRHVGFDIVRNSHLGFIAFPAFALTKIFQKYGARKSEDFSALQASISATKKSRLLEYSLLFEEKYLSHISLPFGIRVLVTARKPLSHDPYA
jgi:ubiquinone/menaquinone biosynthesis C-methylase UbiE